jgi:hypothetical protein
MAEQTTSERRVGLPEAVAQLRADLSKARREGDGKDVRFAVEEVQVELAVEFGWTREGGGGFKLFSFVDVSGKVGATDKATHRVTLKLKIDESGGQSPGVIGDGAVPDYTPRGGSGSAR